MYITVNVTAFAGLLAMWCDDDDAVSDVKVTKNG